MGIKKCLVEFEIPQHVFLLSKRGYMDLFC